MEPRGMPRLLSDAGTEGRGELLRDVHLKPQIFSASLGDEVRQVVAAVLGVSE